MPSELPTDIIVAKIRHPIPRTVSNPPKNLFRFMFFIIKSFDKKNPFSKDLFLNKNFIRLKLYLLQK